MTEPVVLGDPKPDSPPAKPAPEVNPEPIKVRRGERVLDRIMGEITPAGTDTDKIKVLLYSEPGVGKTTLAAGAPDPLFIDVDRGTRSIARMEPKPAVLKYRSIEQVEAIVRYAKEGNERFDQYGTFVLDTITMLQARLLDSQLRTKGEGMPVYKAGWDEYGENTQRLHMLLLQFMDIDKNLICCAHCKSEKNDATGFTVVRPYLTPGLARTINGIFDVVAYMRINAKGERIMEMAPSKTVVAKSRLNLPKETTKPTWASFTEKDSN